MNIKLHERNEEIKKEIAEKKLQETDILRKYNLKDLENIRKLDLYFLLDIPEYRFKKIPEKILLKKHRERMFRYKPSKTDQRIFFAFKKAFDILKDPFWKRKYDQFFVEEIQIEDKIYKENIFFETFDPIFKNYSIFSKFQPTPNLGDKNYSKLEIQNFYKFWKNFESTRTFEFISYIPNYNSLDERAKEQHEQNFRREKKDLFNSHVLEVRNIAKICERNDPRIEREKISVNPKLLINNWTENDILLFLRLKKKFKNGNQIDWKGFLKEFKSENKVKRSMREILIKNTQIENLMPEKNKQKK